MAKKKSARKKKTFTVEEANQMLPLVRSIVQDIANLAQDLVQRQERLSRIAPNAKNRADAYGEEFQEMENELAKDAARMEEYVDELRKLGVDLKGWDGIIDFPGQMDGREVCLCWKLGEPEVSHWHEVDSGFTGRQPLFQESGIRSQESDPMFLTPDS